MLKRWIAGFCVMACVSSPVLAETACAPETLAGAIDRYAMAPFSARTWRVLKGLGDPMIDESYPSSDYWTWLDEWKKLSAELAPDAKYLQDIGYDCRIGYPLEVLKERIAKLGKDNAYVAQWLRAQDKVMEACDESGAMDLRLPDPSEVDATLATLQQEDRAYQEASIAFYRDKPRAIELFKAIATSNSPHRAAARYNVANLLANGKQLVEARKESEAILADPSLASVHGITKELLGYIANLEDTAEGWTALINDKVAIIEQPKDIIDRTEASRKEYANALYDIDYAGVRGKDDDWWLDGKLPENPTISKALVDAARAQPMVLWMMAGQSADQTYRAGPWSLIGAKWQSRLTTLIDKTMSVRPAADGFPPLARGMLLAEMALPSETARNALWSQAHTAIAAAESSCGEDAATAAAGHLLTHAVRLSAMSGHVDEALAELAKVPFKPAQAYYDNTVLKLAEYLLGQGKIKDARALRDRLLTAEFMATIPESSRSGVVDRYAEFMGWIAEDEAHWKAALALHSERTANAVLNFLPTRVLWTYAEDPIFTGDERGLLARAAWTRSLARGRTSTAVQDELLFSLNPKLKETAEKVSTDYPSASPAHRRLLTILRSPRFGILTTAPGLWEGMAATHDNFNEIESWDVNDKNWWCPFETDRQLDGLRDQFDAALGLSFFDDYGNADLDPVYDPAVRKGVNRSREAILRNHPMVRRISWKEIAALAAVPSGPKLLSQSAVRWAKASKGDDGAPEALALAVRTTRYGCRWHGRHGSYSRAAQELLQSRFKETSWAQQTPYWFDCMRQEWDKDYNRISVCEAKTWGKQPLPR